MLKVAPSTVSRALKDHPDISEATKVQVKRLAEELRYEPNPIAKSLRDHKTHTIGIIIPELVHYFFSTVLSGIESVALDAGYNLLICTSNGRYDREVSVAKVLLHRQVDGLLISVCKNSKDHDHLAEYVARDVPLVFFDCASEAIEADQVVIDDYRAAKNAVVHLLGQGCRAIAYMGGSPSLLINQRRLEGYKVALQEHGLELDPRLIFHVEEGTAEEGREAARELLSQGIPIDGVFATADMMAIGVMKEIKSHGLKVPEDVALVGFSNWEISELYQPALTTVTQPGYEMGACAMQMLLERMEDNGVKVRTRTLDTELLVRTSSLRK